MFSVRKFLKEFSLLFLKNFGEIAIGRNTPSEEVENMKNLNFDFIKFLKSAKGLCPGFLVHGNLEDRPLLFLKNFGEIPMGGTPVAGGLKL